MDIAMPLLNGIEAARQIAARLPQAAIVFLSMHADESYVLRALKAGARAYLLKDSAEHDLIEAVRAVKGGVFQSRHQQDAGGGLHAADARAEGGRQLRIADHARAGDCAVRDSEGRDPLSSI